MVQGGQTSPFDAWNGLRGIRTLVPRVRQQSASAQRVAESKRNIPHFSYVEEIDLTGALGA